ncbi:MAG: hypothetical protein LBR12_05360 [Opitutaceae bacterium]|jgi:hypothetical protein|nr:hypothetical protein [Opitutaceae bacterium]
MMPPKILCAALLCLAFPFIAKPALAASPQKPASNFIELPAAGGGSLRLTGVWDAWPAGFWASDTSGETAFHPWGDVDAAALDAARPELLKAMLSARQNQWDEPLNLGVFQNILTPLQVARLVKTALCSPLKWTLPPKQLPRLKEEIAALGSFDFPAEFVRRAPLQSAKKNSAKKKPSGTEQAAAAGKTRAEKTPAAGKNTKAKDAAATRPKRDPNAAAGVIGLLLYASFGDAEKAAVRSALERNADEVAGLASLLRRTAASARSYPRGELQRAAAELSRLRALAARDNPPDAAPAWTSGSLDNLDQVALLAATNAFAASLEAAQKDVAMTRRALDDLKTLLRVLDRPVFRR